MFAIGGIGRNNLPLVTSCGVKRIAVCRDILLANDVPTSVGDLLYANSQRVKESLRVLEEFAKLVNIKAAEKLKRLRYAAYEVEKDALGRM